ncbi:hypothetical protein TGARI_315465 [Toxoplasma gondii ARI]|uniref:Uncharacterized protein n=1 Tax=Toxoplasma gondii ARI TaxID=1074872 RepID=A0A139XN34_TOXGO|nr:hypothetical protein TGARI_315465 [Toxoplasma gondii ARI]
MPSYTQLCRDANPCLAPHLRCICLKFSAMHKDSCCESRLQGISFLELETQVFSLEQVYKSDLIPSVSSQSYRIHFFQFAHIQFSRSFLHSLSTASRVTQALAHRKLRPHVEIWARIEGMVFSGAGVCIVFSSVSRDAMPGSSLILSERSTFIDPHLGAFRCAQYSKRERWTFSIEWRPNTLETAEMGTPRCLPPLAD